MSVRTAIYRLYSADGTLLYVGMSNDPDRRFGEHADSQPWWAEVRKFEVGTWYPSRSAAAEAERVAIRSEQPKHNKRRATGNTPIVNFRIPLAVVSAAKAEAARLGTTVTTLVRDFLEWYISVPLHTPFEEYEPPQAA